MGSGKAGELEPGTYIACSASVRSMARRPGVVRNGHDHKCPFWLAWLNKLRAVCLVVLAPAVFLRSVLIGCFFVGGSGSPLSCLQRVAEDRF